MAGANAAHAAENYYQLVTALLLMWSSLGYQQQVGSCLTYTCPVGWGAAGEAEQSSDHGIYPELQWLRREQLLLLLLPRAETGSLQCLVHQSGLSVPASRHLLSYPAQ